MWILRIRRLFVGGEMVVVSCGLIRYLALWERGAGVFFDCFFPCSF